MHTPASIRSHPIHPMLVPMPIALWMFGCWGDLKARQGARDWERTSYRAIQAGVFTAPLVAIPGFIDWLSLEDPKLIRLGAFHMGSNLTALALFAASLWRRTRDDGVSGIALALSFGGLATLLVGGWLGGHLVYKHKVGVEPPAKPAEKPALPPRRQTPVLK